MKKISTLLVLAAALAMGAANAQTLKVIKVASLTPLSGPQSSIGELEKLGAELAVNEEKAAFKKLGFDLQFVPTDDQATPDVGTAAARRLASDKEVLAIMGTNNSGVVIPSSEAVKDDHLAFVSPANTGVRVTDRGLLNVNRVVARDDSQGPGAAKYIVETLKAKSVYVLNDKTAYGAGLSGEVEKYLKSKNINIVASEGTEEKSNFQPLVIKIKALKPDVIYLGGIYDQAGVLLKQLREAGVTTPLMGGDGYDDPTLLKIAGAGAKNAYYTTVSAPPEKFPAAKKFVTDFTKSFGKEPSGFSITGYDAMKVVLKGIKNAIGTSKDVPSREMVEKSIRAAKITGLTGKIEFNSIGDRKEVKLFIIKIGDDLDPKVVGEVKIVNPKQ
jgi:branched-chain amino acid transport system substrate-binding protein